MVSIEFSQANFRKRVFAPDCLSFDDDDADDDGGVSGPKRFRVGKLENRAEKFFDVELLKKRSQRFGEEVSPVLRTVSLF